MALVFEGKVARVSGGGFNSFAPRSISDTEAITYSVLLSDDADPDLLPIELTEDYVLQQSIIPGIDEPMPEVNKSLFYFRGVNGLQVKPWLICSRKTAERDAQNSFLFRLAAEFSTFNRVSLEENDLRLITVPNSVAEYPFLVESIWSEEDKVIYEEATKTNQTPLRLPTGNLYSEPFKRRQPKRSIRQTQFEVLADVDATIEARLFTVQDRIFQGAAADPPRWMITKIDYQDVVVPLMGLFPPVELVPAFIMTYTIEYTSRDGGWLDRRALIDTHYLTTGGDLSTKTANRDPTDGSTIIPGLILANGTAKNPQTGEPDFQDYRVQPVGDWSFLRQ